MSFLIRVPRHELRAVRGRRSDTPDNRHRDVMALFGPIEGLPRKDAGILFRLDTTPGGLPVFLIRAQIRPEHPTPHTVVLEEQLHSFEYGSLLAFRIAINAVQRKKTGGIRPVPSEFLSSELLEEDDLRGNSSDEPSDSAPASALPEQSEAWRAPALSSWLAQKLSPALVDVAILTHEREVVGGQRSSGSFEHSDKVVQVDTIDGVARVADASALNTLLSQGVGRARAYGCGLLTVRPLR